MSAGHVVVIGGGIAGVSAAARLRELGGPGITITIVEQSDRLGGKIRTGRIADLPTETGAETFLVRRPEATALADGVGLGEALVHPAAAPAGLVIDGRLHDLPRATVMGVPADSATVAGILTATGLARLAHEPAGHGPLLDTDDIAVGALVRGRYGDEITDRLVDPLLGGVYSGRADDLSLDVTIPRLAAAAREHSTLAEAVRACLPPATTNADQPAPGPTRPDPASSGASGTGPASAAIGADQPGHGPARPGPFSSGQASRGLGAGDPVGSDPAFRGAAGTAEAGPSRASSGMASPVFGSVEGGLSRLVDAVVAASGAEIRLGKPVRELTRTPTGWRLVVGDTRGPDIVECDAVVVAVPARPASRLLAPAAARAAAELGVLDYASIGLVTMALPSVALPRRSGFLVPATEGRDVKAATFFTRKWPHRIDGAVDVVRVSMGRYGEERVLQRDDAELARIAHTELSEMLKIALPTPVETVVTRWGGGLPQYGPGHLDRVRRAREALAAHPVALAGAAVDGVGIPACIASGRAAAEAVLSGR